MVGARDRPLADMAAPGKILAVARPGDAVDVFIAFAVALAGALGFALDFVESYDDPPAGIADCYAIGPAAVADVLRREGEIINRATAPAHQAFDAAVAGSKIAGTWAAVSAAQLASEATRRARDAAFVLLARPARRLRPASRLAEQLLSDGTPLLLVPEKPPRHGVFGTILCAWDGSLQAERALRASAPLLARAATVRLISIGDPSPPERARHRRRISLVPSRRKASSPSAFASSGHRQHRGDLAGLLCPQPRRSAGDGRLPPSSYARAAFWRRHARDIGEQRRANLHCPLTCAGSAR